MVPEENDPVWQGYKSIVSHHQYKNPEDWSQPIHQPDGLASERQKERQTSLPPLCIFPKFTEFLCKSFNNIQICADLYYTVFGAQFMNSWNGIHHHYPEFVCSQFS